MENYHVVKELDPFTSVFTIRAVRYVKSLNSFFGKRFKTEEEAQQYANLMNEKIQKGEIR